MTVTVSVFAQCWWEKRCNDRDRCHSFERYHIMVATCASMTQSATCGWKRDSGSRDSGSDTRVRRIQRSISTVTAQNSRQGNDQSNTDTDTDTIITTTLLKTQSSFFPSHSTLATTLILHLNPFHDDNPNSLFYLRQSSRKQMGRILALTTIRSNWKRSTRSTGIDSLLLQKNDFNTCWSNWKTLELQYSESPITTITQDDARTKPQKKKKGKILVD